MSGRFATFSTPGLATAQRDGLLSKADKAKIDNILTPYNASGTGVVADFDAIAKSGAYNGYNATGAPVANAWFLVQHLEHYGNPGYASQLARRMEAWDTALYVRQRIGAWSAWRAI